VKEPLKRAEREFRGTFYETQTADHTVRKSTFPLLPGSYLPNSALRRVPTLPTTSQKRTKETCLRLVRDLFETKSMTKIPLAPMGLLAHRSAHA
jgi:hypothetical protein